MRKSYKIIHEDDDLVVLDKSGHVLTIEDRYDPVKKNLKSMMINRFGKIYVVHRLDYETSGVILFARNEKSHKNLSQQFEDRKVKKTYLALTKNPDESTGVISAPISTHPVKHGIYIPDEHGKQARTEYETLKTFHNYALVKLTPITGRTHQIRVHLKSMGAPLLTDKKYGMSDAFYLSQIKKVRMGRDQTERPLINRSSLHAYLLEFTHPSENRALSFIAPLHKDMKAVVYQFEKHFGVTEYQSL